MPAASYDEALAAASLAALESRLRDEASNAQRQAFRLGVTVAELETGKPGLFDPDAQAFAEEFEFQSIRSLTAETAARTRVAALDGIRRGLGADELGQAISGVSGHTVARGVLIARTETNRAANYGRLSAYKKSGVVRAKTWVSTLDDRVRPDHLAADGDTVPVDRPFTKGAARGRMAPPAAPNCRCTIAPATILSDPAEDRARSAAVKSHARDLGVDLDEAARAPTGLPVTVREVKPERVVVGFRGIVTREIPRLRAAEDRHAGNVKRILEGWPGLLRRTGAIRDVRAIVAKPAFVEVMA